MTLRFETSEDQIYHQLARAAGLPFVDARSLSVSPGIRQKLPPEMARERRCIPLIFNSRRIVLVVDDPFTALTTQPFFILRELGLQDSRRVEFALAAPTPLGECLERWY